MKPTLLIVAGANGSGKTTLMKNYSKLIEDIAFINPDDIAKSLDKKYDGKDNILILRASKIAIKEQENMIKIKNHLGLKQHFRGKENLN